MMKIVFCGTPQFAVPSLRALLDQGFDVQLVVSQPDRPSGRGMQVAHTPVKQLALEHGVEVIQPEKIKNNQEFRARLERIAPEAIVVVAYGRIIPQWMIDLPPLGNINGHASLLPKYRGAAPIQWAIAMGESVTGTTTMRIDAGLDTGDMLLVERVAIAREDTTASLHDKLAALGGRLVVEALELAACGGLQRTPQPAEGVTYAHKIEKAEAAIAWAQPAAAIERRIRAFDPFPGATAQVGGETVKVWRARAVPGRHAAAPGTIVSVDEHGIGVACGDGARLELTELQRPGGKRLPAADFLRGFPLAPGARLS